MLLKKNERILFTGDSVTDFGRKRPVGEGLGDGVGTGYVRYVESFLNAFYPELDVRVSNTGISGNNTRDLKARFDTDVLALEADWVSILIGINDVWRQFDCPSLPNQHVLPEEYEANLEEMVSRAEKKSKIILMTPYYMEPIAEDPMRRRMDEYGAIVRRVAKKHGCLLVDLQEMFNEYFTKRHSSAVSWDRIHPNHTGAMLIANAVLRALGFERERLF